MGRGEGTAHSRRRKTTTRRRTELPLPKETKQSQATLAKHAEYKTSRGVEFSNVTTNDVQFTSAEEGLSPSRRGLRRF